MTGWQRFFILILCYFAVLVMFPYYPTGSGVTFALASFGIFCAVIIVVTLIVNMLAIYKLPTLNALITLLFVGVVFYTLLNYLPQHERPAPLQQLKHGELPTTADMKLGMRRLTFNRDFHKEAYQRKTRYGAGEQLGTKQELGGARRSLTGDTQ